MSILLLIIFLDLLRVIRKGPAVKQAVDDAIDQCSQVLNLRESIEACRVQAEDAADENQKRAHITRGAIDISVFESLKLMLTTGIRLLKRYFSLIVFQAYLQSTEPDTIGTTQTFEDWVLNRPGIRPISILTISTYRLS